ncbi:hypothetical protein Q3G72_010285 [Acer saccharum]|nr:hypothetical protein Q3G72_010285 [Acer saccharum]
MLSCLTKWSSAKDILEHRQCANESVALQKLEGARKAAENAIHVCLVDEQVNKAVLGANGAATAARVAAVKGVQNQVDGKFCKTDVQDDSFG